MSQSAVFWSLQPEPFAARYLDIGGRVPEAAWHSLVHECLIEEWDAGWDCGSLFHEEEDGALGMSVSDALSDEAREAWQDFLAALRADDEPCPWITALGSGDQGDSGVVAPQALARIARRVRETGVLEEACRLLEAEGNDASGLVELGAFVERAADVGAWVVWRNH